MYCYLYMLHQCVVTVLLLYTHILYHYDFCLSYYSLTYSIGSPPPPPPLRTNFCLRLSGCMIDY